MRNDIRLWTVTLMRGAIAMLAGLVILTVPDLARTTLLLPMAVVVAVFSLAAYGLIDSAFVFSTGFFTQSRIAKYALFAQGFVGMTAGVLFASTAFNSVHLHWFLYLIAIQAICAGVAEWLIARHAYTSTASLWNHVAACVAIACGLCYLAAAVHVGNHFEPRENSWLLYGYLLTFGAAQVVTSARMLYTDFHPAVVAQAREN